MSGQSADDTERGSIWKDCAECGSPNTRLGPVDGDCPIICEDCEAETKGINGWSAA